MIDEIEYTDAPLTPQEILIKGGTPAEVEGDDWYKPTGLKQGLSLDQIREIRGRMISVRSPLTLRFLGLSGIPSFTLEPLDDSGITLKDPSIAEIDKNTGELARREGLMDKVSATFKEMGMDLHTRPVSNTPEGQNLGEQKG